MLERLQKIIARAGIASRRHAEELILSGQVRVNGVVVTELGAKADPETDRVEAAGRVAEQPTGVEYYMLHKPAHVVSTMSDPEGRGTIRHLLRGLSGGVFPVGRLDYASSGLILLTTDGALADRIFKISASMPQVYWVKVAGRLDDDALQEIRRRAQVRMRRLRAPGSAQPQPENPWFEVEMNNSANDLLRRTLFVMEHPVEKMKRVKLGPLDLGSLPETLYRKLEPDEIAQLRAAVERAEKAPRPPAGKRVKRRFRPRPLSNGVPANAPPHQAPPPPPETPAFARAGFNPAGPQQRGSGAPAFRPQKPSGPGFPRQGRPERSDSQPPRFQRPGPGESRFQKQGPNGPDSRTPGFRGPRPSGPGFQKRGFTGPSSERPSFKGPGSGRPNFEKRGPSGARPQQPGFQRPGPSGPGFQKPSGPKFDKQGPSGHRPDRPGFQRPGQSGPSFQKSGWQRTGSSGKGFPQQGASGPGFQKPGPRGTGSPRPGSRGPRPSRPGPSGKGFQNRGPSGHNDSRMGFQRSGPSGDGFKKREPHEGQGPRGANSQGPGGQGRSPVGPGFQRPGFKGSRPQRPAPGRSGWRGPGPKGKPDK